MELGIFNALVQSNKTEFDVHDLSTATGGDALLIGNIRYVNERIGSSNQTSARIMRILISMGVFVETKEGKYGLTPRSSIFVDASPLAQALVHL